MDWEKHELTFLTRIETLYGDPSLNGRKFSFKSLQMEKKSDNKSSRMMKEVVPTMLQEVLTRFEKVFDVPTQLPPLHNREHEINLKQVTNPISVRPFHYPHKQKEEMEQLVS